MSVPLKAGLLLADDHAMVRRGLRLILDAEPDLEVVAEAGDGAEAVEQALRTEIDLAILDVSMPRLTGLQAAREIARQRPAIRLLMLSMHDNEEYLFEALSVGASGYVLKSAVDQDLVGACRAALRGEPFLYPAAVTTLIRSHLERRRDDPDHDPLSPREQEVVKLIAQGMSGREIAETLDHQPQDRRAPPREHPREARPAGPRRRHPLRHQTRTDRTVSVTSQLRLAGVADALRIRPAGLHARRWLWLFIGARAGGALVATGLLALQPLTDADPPLATLALLWGTATIVAVRLWPWLMGRPVAWALDAGVVLVLVVASGEWRSPFYLLAVSALIPPATTLTVSGAVAVGIGFSAIYFALALTLGIEWDALASTARLESFSTHLLIPILVVVALAHGTRLLDRLDAERERAEGLALEGERRRIAWELHDSAKQRIHAAQLVLSSLTPQLEAVDAERLGIALAELDGSASDLEASLTELRTTLGGLPLDEAIGRRAAELAAASGVEITVRGSAPSLPTFVAVHAYRVACEAMSNALRHAEPEHIDVTLDRHAGVLAVRVDDDGRGMSEPSEPSTGLESMRARAQALGGRLILESRPRVGTRVELEVPLRGVG